MFSTGLKSFLPLKKDSKTTVKPTNGTVNDKALIIEFWLADKYNSNAKKSLKINSNTMIITLATIISDNIEFRNARIIKIKTNKKIKFNLLYDSNRSLQKKIKLEQLRRETN